MAIVGTVGSYVFTPTIKEVTLCLQDEVDVSHPGLGNFRCCCLQYITDGAPFCATRDQCKFAGIIVHTRLQAQTAYLEEKLMVDQSSVVTATETDYTLD